MYLGLSRRVSSKASLFFFPLSLVIVVAPKKKDFKVVASKEEARVWNTQETEKARRDPDVAQRRLIF